MSLCVRGIGEQPPAVLTRSHYERIASPLPVQRGTVSLSTCQVLNTFLYVAGQGCQWRGVPVGFGTCHTNLPRLKRRSRIEHSRPGLRVTAADASGLRPCLLPAPWCQGAIPLERGRQKNETSPAAAPKAAGPPRFLGWPRLLHPAVRAHRDRPNRVGCPQSPARRQSVFRDRSMSGGREDRLLGASPCSPGRAPSARGSRNAPGYSSASHCSSMDCDRGTRPSPVDCRGHSRLPLQLSSS